MKKTKTVIIPFISYDELEGFHFTRRTDDINRVYVFYSVENEINALLSARGISIRDGITLPETCAIESAVEIDTQVSELIPSYCGTGPLRKHVRFDRIGGAYVYEPTQ